MSVMVVYCMSVMVVHYMSVMVVSCMSVMVVYCMSVMVVSCMSANLLHISVYPVHWYCALNMHSEFGCQGRMKHRLMTTCKGVQIFSSITCGCW